MAMSVMHGIWHGVWHGVWHGMCVAWPNYMGHNYVGQNLPPAQWIGGSATSNPRVKFSTPLLFIFEFIGSRDYDGIASYPFNNHSFNPSHYCTLEWHVYDGARLYGGVWGLALATAGGHLRHQFHRQDFLLRVPRKAVPQKHRPTCSCALGAPVANACL